VTEQCAGQLALPLWPALHPCPVCEADRWALGHYTEPGSLQPPYTTEDLVAHIGACPRDDLVELWVDPF